MSYMKIIENVAHLTTQEKFFLVLFSRKAIFLLMTGMFYLMNVGNQVVDFLSLC